LISALNDRSWLDHISRSEGQVVFERSYIELLLKRTVLRDGAVDVAEVLRVRTSVVLFELRLLSCLEAKC
jgi:hypothetical protein